MRRSRLLLYVALALSGLVYSGSNAWAQRCAVQLSVHPYATVFLLGKANSSIAARWSQS
jgi:hypothetical protein